MISVKDLRMVYPNGFEALRRVNLEIKGGEFVCIIGRSGAGKSTLLRCLNGLLTPTSGQVIVAGVDLTTADDKSRLLLRRRVGFVFQEYNLVERLSVLANVLCGRLGYNPTLKTTLRMFPPSERVIALSALERVRLLERAEQRADSLSGGEKQRVALARALAQEPVVLLADEPVASLDPELAMGVMSDVQRAAKEINVPTIVNIHDINLARMFADRVVGIARGEVIYDGKVEGLTPTVLDDVYRFDKKRRAPEVAGPAGERDGDRVAVPA